MLLLASITVGLCCLLCLEVSMVCCLLWLDRIYYIVLTEDEMFVQSLRLHIYQIKSKSTSIGFYPFDLWIPRVFPIVLYPSPSVFFRLLDKQVSGDRDKLTNFDYKIYKQC